MFCEFTTYAQVGAVVVGNLLSIWPVSSMRFPPGTLKIRSEAHSALHFSLSSKATSCVMGTPFGNLRNISLTNHISNSVFPRPLETSTVKTHIKHLATPINEEHRHTSRASQSHSPCALSGLASSGEPK